MNNMLNLINKDIFSGFDKKKKVRKTDKKTKNQKELVRNYEKGKQKTIKSKGKPVE